MSTKIHSSALVLIPPEEIWGPIQSIRHRYDRQVRRWMPHITLVYPFRPPSDYDQLQKPLSSALRSFAPFRIELSEFHFFQHGSRSFTLWLKPEPREPLVKLQAALTRVVPDCDDVIRHRGGFNPHLSVGQVRGRRADCRQLLHSIAAAWVPLDFTATEVSLIWRKDPPDDVFRVDRRIPLGD